MISLLQGIVLGTIQGITEWMPVSSTTINTLILMYFFGATPDKAYGISIWLHSGTLLAAIIYFRHEIIDILRHLPRYVRHPSAKANEHNALITFLIITTLVSGLIAIPLVLLGFEMRAIPAELVMAILGLLLIVTGLVQKYARRLTGTRQDTGFKDALVLGAAQGLSVFPGLSRSGITVSALLFRGFEAKHAIRVSFLASIPYVLAGEIGLNLVTDVSYDAVSLAAVASAFVFGILTISLLLKIAARVQFWKFCLLLGALSFLPLLVERL